LSNKKIVILTDNPSSKRVLSKLAALPVSSEVNKDFGLKAKDQLPSH